MDLSRILDDMDWRAGRIELDTRADTCVAGKNFRLAEPTGETVDVTPFSEEYDTIGDVPIGTVETAYTCPKTGETIILVGHQHLYFGDRMNHSLWNTNQIQNHDGKVYDCPKQFDMDSPFVIELMDDEDKVFEIPLKLHGVIQYIDTHYPSDEELATCCRIRVILRLVNKPLIPMMNIEFNKLLNFLRGRLLHALHKKTMNSFKP